jgi:hypothetical protein
MNDARGCALARIDTCGRAYREAISARAVSEQFAEPDAGDDHATVTVPDQHDAGQLLGLDDGNHVADVGIKVDRRG